MKVTLTIPINDAERILRDAAKNAALYGGLMDHVTRRTGGNQPERGYGYGKTFEEVRENWRRKFIAAKQLVECFGVEYEPTSEAETLTVGYGHKPHPDAKTRKEAASMGFNRVVTDFDKRHPEYRGAVHLAACEAAASRVVRAWHLTLATESKR